MIAPTIVVLICTLGLRGCLVHFPERFVYQVGDSITMSVAWENRTWKERVPAGYTYAQHSFMGDRIADHLDMVTYYGERNAPERLVIELGSNDARAGWGAEAREAYRQLVDAAPDRTCVVAVLPYLHEDAPSAPAEHESFERARADVTTIVSERPRHQIADMADFVRMNPEMLDGDGLHLRARLGGDERDQRVKDAFRDWLFGFVDACVGAASGGS